MATLALGAAGAGIGSAIPGLGTLAGAKIGMAIGSYIDAANANAQAPLSDLKIGASQYGLAIPRGWGRFQVAGNVVWAKSYPNGDQIHLHSLGANKKGGNPSQYIETVAITFCAGTITCPNGDQITRNPVLKRLWADDLVVYDSSRTDTMLTLGDTVISYPGTETQLQDPTIVAIKGSAKTPAYRGLCYVVLPLIYLTLFGNSNPTWRAEFETDAVTVGDVFSDIGRSTGLLTTDMDVTQATAVVTGFIQDSQIGGADATAGLLRAYAYDAVDVDGVLRLVARGGASTVTISATDLGAATNGNHSENAAYEVTRKNTLTMPSRLEVTFMNRDATYEACTKRAVRRNIAGTAPNSKSTKLPLVLSENDGQQIVDRWLDEEWLEIEPYKFALPWAYLATCPGDPVTLPTKSGSIRLRVTALESGGMTEMRVTAVPDNAALYTGPALGSSPPNSRAAASQLVVPTDWIAWSGDELTDADQAAPGFYVAANGGPGWKGTTIYYSSDGGTSWSTGINSNVAATFGVTTSTLSASGAVANAFDVTNTVGIDLSGVNGAAASTTNALVVAGENWAVCGVEILGFSTASLTGNSLYTMSDIDRGLRGSAMSGHTTGEMFALNDGGLVRVSVLPALIGVSLLVACVSPDQTIADVTPTTVTVAAPTASSIATRVGALVAPSFLTSPQVFSSLTYDNAWHTLSPTGLPSGAVLLILDGYVENSGSPDNADQTLSVRQTSGGATYLCSRTRGVTGSYTGEQAFGQILVPCTPTQTFDYLMTASVVAAEIRVIGYWS